MNGTVERRVRRSAVHARRAAAALHRLPVVLALASVLSTVQAQTPYYVDGARPDDAGDGLSWATAKKTIQAAVDLAASGDAVLVTNGTYLVATNILVTNGITLTGVTGADATHIARTGAGNKRILYLDHAGALVEGFTIRDGIGLPGAGIYMTGGTVQDCVISNNTLGMNQGVGNGVRMFGGEVRRCRVVNNRSTGHATHGAGIYASGGLVSHCVITGNTTAANSSGYRSSGAGVYLSGGATLRNCLVAANDAQSGGQGGGVYLTGAGSVVENCTIVHNRSGWEEGGGIYIEGGAVTNSIVYFNEAPTYHQTANYRLGGSGFAHSCATPLPAGPGNCAGDPLLAAPLLADYRPAPGSPCLNTGTNLPWMPAASDLDGRARMAGAAPDMGAYERHAGALACAFDATPRVAFAPTQVAFTAWADGTNTTAISYAWDFDNNGAVDLQGGAHAAPLWSYATPGVYTVRLVVQNQPGETAAFTQTNFVAILSTNMFVSPSGLHVAPFASGAAAATNLLDPLQLAIAGVHVRVAPGVYSGARHIVVDKAVRITGEGGAAATHVRRSSGLARVFYLDHPDAVIEGLTIRDGNGMTGAGVYMTAGRLQDCVISNNVLGMGQGPGAGVRMSSGEVSRCVIVNNRTTGHATHGAGIYATGGFIRHCVITGNTTAADSISYRASGAGVYLSGGARLRGSLVAGNRAQTGGRGGGVYLLGAASLVESSTVVSNACGWEEGGGLYMESGAVTNSIVYFNSATGYPATANCRLGGAGLGFSCATPLPPGPGNIDADPRFQDALTNNYRLAETSPCVDGGTNLPWMAGALDLDGSDRLKGRRLGVDMGAYEAFYAPGGTMVLLQ